MEKKPLADQKSQVVARIKSKGKIFEILVDLSKAMEFKKSGKGFVPDILIFESVFSDYKKGLKVKDDDLRSAFGTTDIYIISERIVKEGEMMLPLEFRKEGKEMKLRQIVDWLSKSCIDPKTMKPHPPERIRSAIEQVGASIKDSEPADAQARQILKLIQKILPIRIETKRIKLKIPAVHTARVYGIVKEFLLKEEWLADGSFSCVVDIPSSSLMGFFDRLNSITHGEAITKEI